MELTAGSAAWAHHTLERTRGKNVTADQVTAQGALVARGARPTDGDWQPAVVDQTPFTGALDVAVWCDVTEVAPGTKLDIWARWNAGDEKPQLQRTGPLDVT